MKSGNWVSQGTRIDISDFFLPVDQCCSMPSNGANLYMCRLVSLNAKCLKRLYIVDKYIQEGEFPSWYLNSKRILIEN